MSNLLNATVQDKSILIVDDNLLIMRVLEKILEGCRHLQTAHDGQDALNIVTERMKGGEEFDLIFMDCLMPVMDGLEAPVAIRRQEVENSLAPTAIIMLTASAQPSQIQMAKQAGCNAHITKPVTPARLFEVLAGVLNGEGETEL